MRKVSDKEAFLLDLLQCDQSELRKHSQSVYEWRGLYLEVLTSEQMKRGKVPAPWYQDINGWKVREMGKKSEKVKKIYAKSRTQRISKTNGK